MGYRNLQLCLCALVVLSAGCNLTPYELRFDGDGGPADGGSFYDASVEDAFDDDAAPDATGTSSDACDPSPEQCDDIDHDCDGDPMNGFDLESNPAHCGVCNKACDLPGTIGQCVESECTFECGTNRWDINEDLDELDSDGCEYTCVPDPGGEEIACNFRDDDCDDEIDEDDGDLLETD